MIPLTEFPTLVEHYAPYFEDVFFEEGFVQFKRYISGLLVGENKTIAGINQLFVSETRSQSSLNRWLKNSPFTIEALHKARLQMLNDIPRTRVKATKGVIGLDDSLLTHYGQGFEKIAKLYDHVSNSYVWAHNLVSLHYSDEQTDYPIDLQLWEPADLERIEAGLRSAGITLKASKVDLKVSNPVKWRQYLLGLWGRKRNHPDVAPLYQSKLEIGQCLLQRWVAANPDLKLPVTFDRWYTQPAFCRYLNDTLKLPYVGTLKKSDEVILRNDKKTLGQFAADLKAEHLAAQDADGQQPVLQKITFRYKGQQETYFSYCQTQRIAKFGKQRLVINFRCADLSDTPVFYISNRRRWQAKGITHIRRHRWPVEVFYEEGKAEGLDQYQLRDFAGIARHVALVAVVYSLLRAAQQDTVLRDNLQQQLKLVLEGSAAFWRRATRADTLLQLATAISAGLLAGQPLSDVIAPYLKAVCS